MFRNRLWSFIIKHLKTLGIPMILGLVVILGFNYRFAEGQRLSNMPNIILISIDTLRSDFLGAYGYDRDTSPTIDKLGSEGVLFLNAFSHSPKTAPSHMSIMTSLTPGAHGVYHGRKAKVLDKNIPTLAEILKRYGYATAGFTGNGGVSRKLGFGRGFDIYEHRHMHNQEVFDYEDAIQWLKKNHDKRFFLFFHTYATHDPYLPPVPYNRLYDPDYNGDIFDSWEELINYVEKKDNENQKKKSKGVWGWYWYKVDKQDPKDVNFLKAAYAGAIRFVDQEIIKTLMEAIEDLGLKENTLIIFTSDHGEAFGEHDNFLHDDLHRETLQVPLILWYPKALPSGKKVDQLVRLIDIMPTIFDLLEIEPDIEMQGESLLPAIDGEELNLTVYSKFHRLKLESIRNKEFSYLVDGPYKKRPVREILYNIQNDPFEQSPIKKEESESLKDELVKWRVRNKEYGSRLGTYKDYEIFKPEAQTIENLKSLGYLH